MTKEAALSKSSLFFYFERLTKSIRFTNYNPLKTGLVDKGMVKISVILY